MYYLIFINKMLAQWKSSNGCKDIVKELNTYLVTIEL